MRQEGAAGPVQVGYLAHPATLPAPYAPDLAPPPPRPDRMAAASPWYGAARFSPPGPGHATLRLLQGELPAPPPLPVLPPRAPDPEPDPAPDPEPDPGPEPEQPSFAPTLQEPPPPGELEETVALATIEAVALEQGEDDPALPELPSIAPQAAELAVAAEPDPYDAPRSWPAPRAASWWEPEVEQGLWQAEAVPGAEPADGTAAAADRALGRRRTSWLVLLLALLAVLVLGVGAAWLFGRVQAPGGTAGMFNAPMVVLRAGEAGHVTAIPASAGQTVEPRSVLLVVHADPPPNPAAAAARARLDVARSRLAALDDALTQPAPATDAARARLADLRQQRAAAAAELNAARDAVDQIAPVLGIDRAVRAGVNGIVRSIETQTGADIAPNAPLARLLDCGHAFLTIGAGSELRAGDTVQVRLPNLPQATAVVRASSGVAEPPDSLVVPLPASALGGACPVGTAATLLLAPPPVQAHNT